ncbi:MAG: hypothetical protein KME31_33140 [Tolypothrix carrinoi HA7290-LM1]|jgi:hypothetical protein|nr:hypothetical protein [Tolypothrix carrinoi HA7290-LM1]
MSLNLDLTGLGAWELTYFQRIQGNAQNKRVRAPLIEPVEIPYLTDKHLFLVGATYVNAPPTWQRAGYLYQQIDGIRIDDAVIFEGLGSNSSTAVDAQRQLVRLNTIQFVNFVQLTETFRLRFEPLPWIPEITLAVWEYRGTESNTTEDLLNAVRAKLETIEFKIDQQS